MMGLRSQTPKERYDSSLKGKATKKNWKDENREKVRKWKREWANSPNGRVSAKNWYKKSPRAMFPLYEKSANKRGLEFKISLDDFIRKIKEPCVYCGNPPPEESTRNGLDRINNNAGYIVENLVACCFNCNQMKGKRSVEDFLEHIRKIVKFQEEVNGTS
jgi:5-methylcytosine-specific restriction endonuclease McrA